MTKSAISQQGLGAGNMLLVANYASDVGYAWWLMEEYWVAIAEWNAIHGRKTILVFPHIGAMPPKIARAPIVVMQLDFWNRSSRNLAKLKELIVTNEIKAVYLTDGPYFSRLYRRLRSWGVRRIINHDHTPGERPPPSRLKRLGKQWLHRVGTWSCDHYIGVSRFVYDRLQSNVCLPPERCHCVLNGIEPIGRKPSLENYVHSQFGIPTDATVIVVAARATFYKGIDFIIRCAAMLSPQAIAKPLYFLHCGDGPDLDALKRLAVEQGVAERFLFAGRRADVRSILQSCDIGMLASRGEAFSLAILEYMSAGLATLVPNNCGNAEAVEDGRTGSVYQHGNLRDACNRLEALVRDPGARRHLGDAAMLAVENRFTIERAVRDLTQLMERIC